MKEMNGSTATPEEGRLMKKSLAVVALAAMFVLAFATVAMASSWTSPSASLWYYTAASAPTTAGSSIFNPWSNGWYGSVEVTTGAFESYAANGGATSPHGGYTTTTIKCATCHSTHGAKPGQEVLLRGGGNLKAANNDPNACVFCHVDSSTGIGLDGTMVYTGSGLEVAGGPAGDGYHSPNPNCKRCHGSVHGKDVMDATQYPVLAARLLRNAGYGTFYSTNAIAKATVAANGFDGTNVSDITSTSDARYWALVGAWCSACHKGSFNSQTNAQANVDASSTTAAMTGHRLNAVVNASWNPKTLGINGGVDSFEQYSNIQIAWKPVANNCQNCHDAKNQTGDAGFPHFASGAAAFLGLAADANGAVTGVGVTATDSANPVITEEATLQDGVCLKCHKSGVSGVGGTF